LLDEANRLDLTAAADRFAAVAEDVMAADAEAAATLLARRAGLTSPTLSRRAAE
jgi:hypothetical protein